MWLVRIAAEDAVFHAPSLSMKLRTPAFCRPVRKRAYFVREMNRTSKFWVLGLALAGALAAAGCHAQNTPATPTEAQARDYVYGAFLTGAAADILSERVNLGPELQQRLAVSPRADYHRIYDALIALTEYQPLRVRKPTPDEVADYTSRVKRDYQGPLFTVEAGDIRLLVQYDLPANNISFVGQLSPTPERPTAAAVERAVVPPPPPAPAAAPKPPPIAIEKPAPPPVAIQKPQKPTPPVAAVESPKPRVVAPERPNPAARVEPPERTGPCEIKSVMSDQDLINCSAPAATMEKPRPQTPAMERATPAVVAVEKPKPVTRAEERKPAAPCVVKPVMSEEDLLNCGARPR
ncbi:MAG TPA: hypothetical protein VEL04_03115 [Burkholderiales bacterium]|nr:hypothetical protein [Burkholderiales bacterium]